jgi:hypothetical protein
MTNYGRSQERLRNDTVLKKAIALDLEQHRQKLLTAIESMQAAYKALSSTGHVGEDPHFPSSGLLTARVNLSSDMARLAWTADFLATVSDTYYGNMAIRLTDSEADSLKERYKDQLEDSSDQ